MHRLKRLLLVPYHLHPCRRPLRSARNDDLIRYPLNISYLLKANVVIGVVIACILALLFLILIQGCYERSGLRQGVINSGLLLQANEAGYSTLCLL